MTVKTLNRPFTAHIDTRADNSGNTLNFVATNAGVKRDGLDINIAGISTANFENNPVFLWAHDYIGNRLPIGRVPSIRILKSKMKVRVEFDDQDDFAMQVKSKFDRGFLNTVSIGWETIEFDRDANTVVASDLLDVSAVPVPGDPDALIERQKVALRSLGQDLLDRFDDAEETLRTGRTATGSVCTECDEPIGDDENMFMTVDSDGISEVRCVPCADKISGEQTSIDNQEGEQMERLERVVTALDEFRSALSDLIDNADDTDDKSMEALLEAFTDDTTEGDED